MQTFGNQDGGFSIMFDAPTRTLVVTGWGFWSVATAASFSIEVLAACADEGASVLVLDASGLKPQREEGQASFGQVLAALRRLKITRASIVTGNALTRLQLL